MSKAVQRRGGSTAWHTSFVGLPREVTVDTDLNTLRVHDGVTLGGEIIAKASDLPSAWVGIAQAPLPAVFMSATSFTLNADQTALFVVGVRVKLDCGVDGIFYGVTSSATYYSGTGRTTVAVTLDSGALTAHLTGCWHGNDLPAALCNHGHTGPADGGSLNSYIAKAMGTAKGDLIGFSASGVPERLGVGSEGQYLRAVSGSPAWAGPDSTGKVVSFTRDISSASGDQTISGVGFQPRAIMFMSGSSVYTDSNGVSSGMYSSGVNVGNAVIPGSGWSTLAANCIALYQSLSNNSIAVVSSTNSDGFVLTWTKFGTPTSQTMNIMAMCLR